MNGASGTLGWSVVVVVFPLVALVAIVLAGWARRRAAEAESRRREADLLARRQSALLAVATLVARGSDPVDVYPVTATELARALDVEHVTLVRFDEGRWCTVLAVHDGPGEANVHVGDRLALPDDGVGDIPTLGLHCDVSAPITIGDEPRGAVLVGSTRPGPLPCETEKLAGDFADLVATAIANAETRAELTASRMRIVAAADEARRGFERDLQDGARQRIVALGHGMRTVEASVPQENQAVRKQLDNVINGLADLYTNLQELSRGIHPAILTEGGLGPALRALVRRSVVPVGLHVDVDRRLTETIELAGYHVVAEALANAAKHSQATEVTVHVGLDGNDLHVEVADDGIGGTTTADGGSGLVGLRDRVAALGGRLEVLSQPGKGTTLTARLPHRCDD